MPSRAEEQEGRDGHHAVRRALQGSTGVWGWLAWAPLWPGGFGFSGFTRSVLLCQDSVHSVSQEFYSQCWSWSPGAPHTDPCKQPREGRLCPLHFRLHENSGCFLMPWPTKATAAAVQLSLSFPSANCTVAIQIWLSPPHWLTNLPPRLIETLPGQETFIICACLQMLIHNWNWADPELYWFALTVLNAKHISYRWTSEHVLQYL